MRRPIFLPIAALLLTLFGFTRTAFGYIDPGTTSSVFAVAAPFIAMAVGFLGYLAWPFRRAIAALFHKNGTADAETTPEPAESE